jgi:hypothetical protein
VAQRRQLPVCRAQHLKHVVVNLHRYTVRGLGVEREYRTTLCTPDWGLEMLCTYHKEQL